MLGFPAPFAFSRIVPYTGKALPTSPPLRFNYTWSLISNSLSVTTYIHGDIFYSFFEFSEFFFLASMTFMSISVICVRIFFLSFNKHWTWELPDEKRQLIGKDPDARKYWRQEDKGRTEDEMVGWYHWLNGHEFEQTPGNGEGQGSLVCCSPWGHKE